MTMIAFGPVPSRRLGASLGINNVPAKHCSYSCVYCQVGRTPTPETEPRTFFAVDMVVAAVSDRVAQLRRRDQAIDYLTFVPDGEPTLDIGLGDEIARLKPLGIPIAVISNASLQWRPEVRAALAAADLVSVKVDTIDEATWRRVNRPAATLRHDIVLAGIQAFAREYRGKLLTETMLVRDLNDQPEGVAATARWISDLRPEMAYLAYPVRPAVEPWVRPPDPDGYRRLAELFHRNAPQVRALEIEPTPGSWGTTGDAAADILATCAVHPMSEAEVQALLAQAGASWSVVEGLLARGELQATVFEGRRYFVRPQPPV